MTVGLALLSILPIVGLIVFWAMTYVRTDFATRISFAMLALSCALALLAEMLVVREVINSLILPAIVFMLGLLGVAIALGHHKRGLDSNRPLAWGTAGWSLVNISVITALAIVIA